MYIGINAMKIYRGKDTLRSQVQKKCIFHFYFLNVNILLTMID